MKVVYINISQPVKTIKSSIIDLFTKKVVTLKAIHKHLLGSKNANPTQFTGSIA
ncbi:hypothetical protein [Mucilaginibacter sp. FT3.2]|uniref:hypothetical protein n=1 Tax=Mucilaginibacter sp. FT3.2 TaxID=2723090 RepID=UPI00161554AB|nr:hypothetical protein [Mucilaginibacter sp. FT3.2]MBB6231541.1 hypothetical protein [Mucilaginibacter sp. FT3.2]